jgi:hypothetical protein
MLLIRDPTDYPHAYQLRPVKFESKTLYRIDIQQSVTKGPQPRIPINELETKEVIFFEIG